MMVGTGRDFWRQCPGCLPALRRVCLGHGECSSAPVSDQRGVAKMLEKRWENGGNMAKTMNTTMVFGVDTDFCFWIWGQNYEDFVQKRDLGKQ